MRSPCRSECWLVLSACVAISCEQARTIASVSGTPHANPTGESQASPAPLPEPPQQLVNEPAARPTLSIAVYDSRDDDKPESARARFSIASTRDLRICSSWSALEGEHFETRQFYAPQGELYYQKLIPFSTGIDEPYPFTHPVSIPHATVIQPVTPNERGEVVVCDQLAVAGAWIGDHQITGAWRLAILLDGAKIAAASHSFEIEP